MKKIIVALSLALIVCSVTYGAWQSKYSTGTTAVALNFGPASGNLLLKGLNVSSTDPTAAVDMLVRTGSPENLTVAATNAQLTVYVDNSGSQFAGTDIVVIAYDDGTIGNDVVEIGRASCRERV